MINNPQQPTQLVVTEEDYLPVPAIYATGAIFNGTAESLRIAFCEQNQHGTKVHTRCAVVMTLTAALAFRDGLNALLQTVKVTRVN